RAWPRHAPGRRSGTVARRRTHRTRRAYPQWTCRSLGPARGGSDGRAQAQAAQEAGTIPQAFRRTAAPLTGILKPSFSFGSSEMAFVAFTGMDMAPVPTEPRRSTMALSRKLMA